MVFEWYTMGSGLHSVLPSVRTVNDFETEVMQSQLSLNALGGWLGSRQEEQSGGGAVVCTTCLA